MGNDVQLREIERFHRHLQRLGKATSLEESARLWIKKYARLWREHQNGRVLAAA